ncbi:MAG: GGDEF domain-containing protein [Sporolactobacillus sp.]
MIHYLQTIGVGLFIVLLVFINQPRKNRRDAGQRIFLVGLVVLTCLLFLEIPLDVTKLTSAKTAFQQPLMTGVVFLFFVLNPVPVLLWMLYVDSLSQKGGSDPLKRYFLFLLILPAALNALFSCISLFVPFTFTVGAGGHYHRGPLYLFMPLTCYVYLIYYVLIVAFRRRNLLRHEARDMFCAVLPTVAAGVLQNMFAGLNIVLVAMAFSMLFIAVRVQSVEIDYDYLTGLLNRRSFNARLNNWTGNLRSKGVGGIFIDVDGFKHINDVYGHQAGDQALEVVGETLRSLLRRHRRELAARIGGDEFVLLFRTNHPETIVTVVDRLMAGFSDLNRRSRLSFALGVSVGWDFYPPGQVPDARQFVKNIDQAMYSNKLRKRNDLIQAKEDD